jgi:hypothetical protein
MTVTEIQYKLDNLRKRWTTEKDHRKVIELQARALQCAMDLYYEKFPQTTLVEKTA